MSKKTKKNVEEEVVNVDKTIENFKTSGTDLQVHIRTLINSRGE